MAHENLKDRTFQFAVTTIRAAKPLVGDPLGKHLIGQVVRSSGGVASNYGAACHAKSRPDFAAKISTMAEDAAETVLWLRLFTELGLLATAVTQPLVQEGNELTSIAIASARTARRPRRDQRDQRDSVTVRYD
jgi:four helix bundle protein